MMDEVRQGKAHTSSVHFSTLNIEWAILFPSVWCLFAALNGPWQMVVVSWRSCNVLVGKSDTKDQDLNWSSRLATFGWSMLCSWMLLRLLLMLRMWIIWIVDLVYLLKIRNPGDRFPPQVLNGTPCVWRRVVSSSVLCDCDYGLGLTYPNHKIPGTECPQCDPHQRFHSGCCCILWWANKYMKGCGHILKLLMGLAAKRTHQSEVRRESLGWSATSSCATRIASPKRSFSMLDAVYILDFPFRMPGNSKVYPAKWQNIANLFSVWWNLESILLAPGHLNSFAYVKLQCQSVSLTHQNSSRNTLVLLLLLRYFIDAGLSI